MGNLGAEKYFRSIVVFVLIIYKLQVYLIENGRDEERSIIHSSGMPNLFIFYTYYPMMKTEGYLETIDYSDV